MVSLYYRLTHLTEAMPDERLLLSYVQQMNAQPVQCGVCGDDQVGDTNL